MRQAVVAAAVRTPIGRAPSGRLSALRPDELAAFVLGRLLARVPALDPGEVDDVILGCGVPEGEQGLNIGRLAALGAGLPVAVPGMTVNRYCASGLESIAIAAERVMTGQAEVVVAGGVESMSRVPMWGFRPRPHPRWLAEHPDYYISMGQTAEEVARQYGIGREEQDRFALRSHRLAVAATEAGRFREEIVPVPLPDGGVFEQDEAIRRDTSLEALGRLAPAFRKDGTVTAGNASPLSDGAAAALVLSDQKAAKLGIRPLGVFRSFAVAGVAPALMGIGPIAAVPKALRLAGVPSSAVDLVELNEAFAAQVLAVLRALELDLERVNVNGGAIALGHPLGATGTRQVATGLHELNRRGGQYLLVTMCVGGGMGAAAVFERP